MQRVSGNENEVGKKAIQIGKPKSIKASNQLHKYVSFTQMVVDRECTILILQMCMNGVELK